MSEKDSMIESLKQEIKKLQESLSKINKVPMEETTAKL